LVAPITGLVVQPIIGHYSDRTWNKLGRRKPFFLVGALLAAMALTLLPNADVLASFLPVLLIGAGMLMIMDASFNVAMEPFRALVGDMLPEEQRTLGFSVQTFLIGIGAVAGSWLPYILANWFGFNQPAAEGGVADNVIISFYVGAAVLVGAILVTIFKTKEYPPEEEHTTAQEERLVIRYQPSTYRNIGLALLTVGAGFGFFVYLNELDKALYVMTGMLALFGLSYFITSLMMAKGNYKNPYVQIVRDFQNMPKTMVQLAVVQFFSWFSLFAMWIYTTSAVTGHVYQTTDPQSALYNEGADWVGVCFAVYNGVAAAIALLLPIIAKKTSRKMTHMMALTMGGIGLLSIYFVSDPKMLLLSMVGVGIAWASILSVPYAMLAGCLPSNKMGYYMGIFNFFIVIPQIVAASILGALVGTFFHGEAINALIIGGVCMILAGLLTLRVQDDSLVSVPDESTLS